MGNCYSTDHIVTWLYNLIPTNQFRSSFTCFHIRFVRQVVGLLWCIPGKNIVKKSIWKFIGIFPDQVLNFLNVFSELGKIQKKHRNNFTTVGMLL